MPRFAYGLASAVMLAACGVAPDGPASAQVNSGTSKPVASNPFVVTQLAAFDFPWGMAFLPDGRMLITEKQGAVRIVTQQGVKSAPLGGVAKIAFSSQGGLLDVELAPTFATDHQVYLTYSEPNATGDESGLVMARGTLVLDAAGGGRFDNMTVLWRQESKGKGGQFGAIVTFAPDGKSLYLTSGERQRFTPAQDPDQALGKILHLTLDGKPFPGNPGAGKIGAASVMVTDPPANTEAAAGAAKRKVVLDGPNLTQAETWTTGHRNPYGLAFAPDGRLWEIEMGPKGGDELNLIEVGANYGWPLVSYGENYDGTPIPSHATRPDLRKPVIYWTPVIAPSSLIFYSGSMFPQWKGSALVGGLVAKVLVRIVFDGKGGAREAERFDMGARIRCVRQGPDGALWLLEDGAKGGGGHLLKLTPKA